MSIHFEQRTYTATIHKKFSNIDIFFLLISRWKMYIFSITFDYNDFRLDVINQSILIENCSIYCVITKSYHTYNDRNHYRTSKIKIDTSCPDHNLIFSYIYVFMYINLYCIFSVFFDIALFLTSNYFDS